MLFPPKMGAQDRGKLDDLRITGSGYGVMIPQCFGCARVGGNMLWSTDLVEHVTSREEGGKGGGGVTVNEYTYTVSCAMAICRGPIRGVRRIWAEDKLIYDVDSTPSSKHDITVYTGTEEQAVDPLMEAALGAGNVPAYRGIAYAVFEDLLLTDWGNRIPSMSFEVEAPGSSVADILRDLAEQVGIAESDTSFEEAEHRIIGFVIAQRTAARSALEPVLRVGATDLAEIDGMLIAIPRGCPEAATIAEDDLGAHVWSEGRGDPPTRLETKRGQDLELPGRLDLAYFRYDADVTKRTYEQTSQGAVRYTKGDVQEAHTVQAPLAMTDDDARQTAERLLYGEWLERTSHRYALGPKWLKLCPGSPVLLPVNGVNERCRIVGMDIGLFGELRFSAVRDDDVTGILDQSVVGGTPEAAGVPALDAVVPTLFYAWSGYELREEDGLRAGFYVAASGGDGWDGCAIYYSPDGGTTYLDAGNIFDRSVFGETASLLPDGVASNAWEGATTLDVTLDTTGTLESTSKTDVELTYDNAILVGEEVAGFTTAAAGGGGAYTLTTILRGRRDTPMTGHGIGEAFVLLSRAVARVSVDDSLVGQTVKVKCVSPGQTLGDVTAQDVVIRVPSHPYVTVGPNLDFSKDTNSQYVPMVF
ncbi:MAG: hypothetical protein A2V59_06545 [Armatimonadetes bacterium RBG_19FT_COMBO_69_19]|nr:MAG: hypothetical protein A2V59_06545 [Armatimonadetes bacterium RBG_19FT_COMBO_69_19]